MPDLLDDYAKHSGFGFKSPSELAAALREHSVQVAGDGPSGPGYDPETLMLEQDAATLIDYLLAKLKAVESALAHEHDSHVETAKIMRRARERADEATDIVRQARAAWQARTICFSHEKNCDPGSCSCGFDALHDLLG